MPAHFELSGASIALGASSAVRPVDVRRTMSAEPHASQMIDSTPAARSVGELVRSERQRAFGRAKQDTLPAFCRACEFLFACHGECPENRILVTPGGEPGLNWLCGGLKESFVHTERRMRPADVLSRGGEAREVMAILAAEARTTGRNDPCPAAAAGSTSAAVALWPADHLYTVGVTQARAGSVHCCRPKRGPSCPLASPISSSCGGTTSASGTSAATTAA